MSTAFGATRIVCGSIPNRSMSSFRFHWFVVMIVGTDRSIVRTRRQGMKLLYVNRVWGHEDRVWLDPEPLNEFFPLPLVRRDDRWDRSKHRPNAAPGYETSLCQPRLGPRGSCVARSRTAQ